MPPSLSSEKCSQVPRPKCFSGPVYIYMIGIFFILDQNWGDDGGEGELEQKKKSFLLLPLLQKVLPIASTFIHLSGQLFCKHH